ncbi:hypothetical protein B0H19DRAFT_1317789 [Mycena capillaripes]|nr:hypothetical protein B0H19DRAFT_1317789 [Mycena capillaripes]
MNIVVLKREEQLYPNSTAAHPTRSTKTNTSTPTPKGLRLERESAAPVTARKRFVPRRRSQLQRWVHVPVQSGVGPGDGARGQSALLLESRGGALRSISCARWACGDRRDEGLRSRRKIAAGRRELDAQPEVEIPSEFSATDSWLRAQLGMGEAFRCAWSTRWHSIRVFPIGDWARIQRNEESAAGAGDKRGKRRTSRMRDGAEKGGFQKWHEEPRNTERGYATPPGTDAINVSAQEQQDSQYASPPYSGEESSVADHIWAALAGGKRDQAFHSNASPICIAAAGYAGGRHGTILQTRYVRQCETENKTNASADKDSAVKMSYKTPPAQDHMHSPRLSSSESPPSQGKCHSARGERGLGAVDFADPRSLARPGAGSVRG